MSDQTCTADACTERALDRPGSLYCLDHTPVPPMGLEDVRLFIQTLTGAVMMGATRIEFHRARWRFLCTSLLIHKAYDYAQIRFIGDVEDFEHATMHLQFTTDDGQINCLLMQRQDHPDTESDVERALLDGQGPNYPIPSEPSGLEKVDQKVWLPS